MKDRRLAANYAEALLDLVSAEEADAADSLLTAIAQAFKNEPFRDLMCDPAIERETRKHVLYGIADKAGTPRNVRNFLGLVVDHNRTPVLPAIAQLFHEMREDRLGIVRVEMATAVALDEALRQRTEAALAKSTGRQVKVAYRVQPDLVGGAVARVGSRIFDGSLKTQIAQLRQQMAQDR